MFSAELKPYYHSVKARTRHVIESENKPVPPQVADWTQIDVSMHERLVQFINETIQSTAPIGAQHGEEVLRKLNVDERFQTHLHIMHTYVDAMCATPTFTQFLEERKLTPSFLHALVTLHDYGRCVFNATLPLKYIDGVSDGILRRNIPNFPTQYLHSIKLITREEPLPENDSELNTPQQIGLMLKAIDTLGKLDQAGNLMDPDFFFSEGGPYQRWVALQLENGRLPFFVVRNRTSSNGRTEITADDYAEQDISLTQRGMRIIEAATGVAFSSVRATTKESLENSHSTVSLR